MPSRSARLVELLVVFVAAPVAVSMLVPGGWVIPVILLLGLACLIVLLRDPSFDRGQLFNARGARVALPGILIRTALAATIMLVSLRLFAPERLFELPRHRLLIWSIIMVGYPLASAHPQELAFRVYFRHRYSGLFRSEIAYLLANAACFGLAHLIIHKALPIFASFAGGLVLAWNFERHRSGAAAWLEHAIYGWLIFTIGWGWWFYGGSLRIH